MNVYEIEVNVTRASYNERSTHLVQAQNSAKAIEKAVRQARKDGSAKSYDATSLRLIGDPL